MPFSTHHEESDELSGVPDFGPLADRINQSLATPTDHLHEAIRLAAASTDGHFNINRSLATQVAASFGRERALAGPSLRELTDYSNPVTMARAAERYFAGLPLLDDRLQASSLAAMSQRSVAEQLASAAQQPGGAGRFRPLSVTEQLRDFSERRQRRGLFSLHDSWRSMTEYARNRREHESLEGSLAWLTRAVTQPSTLERQLLGARDGHQPATAPDGISSRGRLPLRETHPTPMAFANLASQVRELAQELQADPAVMEVEVDQPAPELLVREVEQVATVVQGFAERLTTEPLATSADVQRLRSDIFAAVEQLHQHIDQQATPAADRPGGWRHYWFVVIPALLTIFAFLAWLAEHVSESAPHPVRTELVRQVQQLRHDVGQRAADAAQRTDSALVYYAPEARIYYAPRRGAKVIGRLERGRLLVVRATHGPYLLVQYLDEDKVQTGYVRRRLLKRVGVSR